MSQSSSWLERLVRGRPSIRWPLHALRLLRAETQTSDAERATLVRFANGAHRLAEIGVFEGLTTGQITSSLPAQSEYFAIDPYFPGRLGINFNRLIAHREVARRANCRVHWFEAIGQDCGSIAKICAAPFDFLFIDGDHTWDGLKGDWLVWRGLIRKGGIVALHDTCNTTFGCQRYAREHIFGDAEFEVIETVDTLTVLRRRT